MTAGRDTHPLAATAAAARSFYPSVSIQLGRSQEAGGWARCADVDNDYIASWERETSRRIERRFGRSHPMTASAFVLGWYGRMPGILGGLFFAADRRVPALGRADIAFTRHETGHLERIALLTSRFWCLPTDPAADHPDATVVAGTEELARVLRAGVRAHADAFLERYAGGARLPRRTLLGVFFDGIDVGVWLPGRATKSAAETITQARQALPGGEPEFRDRSTVHVIEDLKGREHLTRQRVSCCFYYKLAGTADTCLTCPRTSLEERITRLSERKT